MNASEKRIRVQIYATGLGISCVIASMHLNGAWIVATIFAGVAMIVFGFFYKAKQPTAKDEKTQQQNQ